MISKKHIIYSALALAFTASSCVNDLDVQPLNPNVLTGKRAYEDPENYDKGLNKLYSVWALSGQDGAGGSDISGLDAGNTVLLRSWWTLQTATTDEAKVAWPDAWCAEVNGITWSTNIVEPIEGVYQRCMFIVALANEFIKNSDNIADANKKAQYVAEARFNRALAYYILIDTFGNPPFITESNYSIAPKQIGRKELFNWVESELKAIKADLPNARQSYGRADKAVASALLARMYLNAEVYTGEKRYKDCIEQCNEVIAAGYKLAPKYADLFKADNGENPETKSEIIFPVVFDGNKTQSYAMAAIILGSRNGGETSVEKDGINGGWDGFRATSKLPKLFEYADNNNPTAATIKDSRGIFFDANRSIDIQTSVQGTFTSEGWSVHKFTNVTSKKVPGANTTFPDTDFPLFRLADIYLMYAEATVRGASNGDIAKAVEYVNALRKRAYGNDNGNITEAWLKANNFRNILDERSRELYWEGTRRTDLIRFGLFTSSSYTWEGKGGSVTGVGVASKYNIFPIPSSDISVNSSLVQNKEYQ